MKINIELSPIEVKLDIFKKRRRSQFLCILFLKLKKIQLKWKKL